MIVATKSYTYFVKKILYFPRVSCTAPRTRSTIPDIHDWRDALAIVSPSKTPFFV